MSGRVAAGQAGAGHHRLRSLDALRGIAALLVVLGHSMEQGLAFLPAGLARSVLEAVFIEDCNFGRVGVITFFLISGYVIPFSFQHHRPLPSFVVSRAFRLYPAYWLSIAAAVGLAVLLKGVAPPVGVVLANLTMVQAALGAPDLIGVYWTLFYELLFYGCCVAAFAGGLAGSPRYLLGVVAVLCAAAWAAALLRAGHVAHTPPLGIPLFLAVMHLGTLARMADRQSDPALRRSFRAALLLVLMTAGPVSGIGFIQRASHERLLADVTSPYVALFLFLALRRATRVVRRPLLFLGLVSYSLYLFHPLALDLIVAMSRQIGGSAGFALIACAVPAVAIGMATLVQRLVEGPSNKFGRYVRHRLHGKRSCEVV